MAIALEVFGIAEWALLLLWFAAIGWPIFYAIRHNTSIALSLTVGLLLAYLVQVVYLLGVRQAWLSADSWYMWGDF